MKEEKKTRNQLIRELVDLRQRITEMEKTETERKLSERETNKEGTCLSSPFFMIFLKSFT